MLTRENWEGARLDDVVSEAVMVYSTAVPSPITIEGPAVRISAKMALALAMVLHELCTNAAKYGALSVPGGRVDVRWRVDRNEAPVLRLMWQETGGPTVVPPARRGFGTRLIERQVALEFGAEVALDFASTGVRCLIRAPIA